MSYETPTPEEVLEEKPDNIELQEPLSSEERKIFEYKLEEYRGRLQKESNPDPDYFIDAEYKVAILEELLESGSVDYEEVQNQFENRADFKKEVFSGAWRVINDYIETGGKGSVNGTGLRTEEKSTESDPEKIISEMTSFVEVFNYLETIKYLEGSDGTPHGPGKLRRIIRGLRNQEENYELNQLPRTYGFRKKIEELLEAEQG